MEIAKAQIQSGQLTTSNRMNSRLRFLVWMVLGSVLVPYSYQLVAEEHEIEELVVTVRKRVEHLSEVPVSLTILNNAGIKEKGITELNQLEKFAPNTIQTNFGQGSTGHAAVFMRGIGLQDHIITTDPAVGIYLDGVYLGRNMGANMDLVNLERVEVVRGPQGTLSGRNTLGGALNIVTREPKGVNRVDLQLKAGTLGRLNGHLHAETLLSSNLAVAFSGGYKSRDGVGKALNIRHPEADIGQINQLFGRGVAAWEPVDGLKVVGSMDFSRSHQGVSPHSVLVFNPENSFGLDQSDQPLNPYDTYSLNNDLMSTEDETVSHSVVADWDLSELLSVKVILSRRTMWFEGGLDNEKIAPTLIEFPERGEAEQDTFELQVRGITGRIDWITGIFAFSEHGFNDSPFVFRFTGLNDGRPEQIPLSEFDGRLYVEQETNSLGVFGHTDISLIDHWSLGLGVRTTFDDKEAVGSLHYFVPPEAHRSDSWNDMTGDVSLTREIGGSWTVYGSYARGYQAGGYPPRPFGGPETFVAFDPTYADSFEFGIKSVSSESLVLRMSLFHVNYTDLAVQTNELVGDGFLTLVQNAAESTATGLELEGRVLTEKGFTLDFALGLVDAEISNVDEHVYKIRPGDKPALTPSMTLSLAPRFAWKLSRYRLVAALRYYHRSEMFGQVINDDLNVMPRVDLVSTSLTVADPTGDWALRLYGDNLTDETYPLARLDLDPTVLSILSNDRREFGIRFSMCYRQR